MECEIFFLCPRNTCDCLTEERSNAQYRSHVHHIRHVSEWNIQFSSPEADICSCSARMSKKTSCRLYWFWFVKNMDSSSWLDTQLACFVWKHVVLHGVWKDRHQWEYNYTCFIFYLLFITASPPAFSRDAASNFFLLIFNFFAQYLLNIFPLVYEFWTPCIYKSASRCSQ